MRRLGVNRYVQRRRERAWCDRVMWQRRVALAVMTLLVAAVAAAEALALPTVKGVRIGPARRQDPAGPGPDRVRSFQDSRPDGPRPPGDRHATGALGLGRTDCRLSPMQACCACVSDSSLGIPPASWSTLPSRPSCSGHSWCSRAARTRTARPCGGCPSQQCAESRRQTARFLPRLRSRTRWQVHRSGSRQVGGCSEGRTDRIRPTRPSVADPAVERREKRNPLRRYSRPCRSWGLDRPTGPNPCRYLGRNHLLEPHPT